jgi:hypothetical protein
MENKECLYMGRYRGMSFCSLLILKNWIIYKEKKFIGLLELESGKSRSLAPASSGEGLLGAS